MVIKQKRNPVISKKVLRRDMKICQCCGVQGLEVHHIKPVYKGGLAVDSNLITLCHECHKHAPNNEEEFLSYQKSGGARMKRAVSELIKKIESEEESLSLKDLNKLVLNSRLKIFEEAYKGYIINDEELYK
ncbi:MAG: HNH endonuclease [Dolichospermum sp. DEX182a]|jgi:hypothetical protein|nr:HNH endonuclease [Dolichospermum sp. DEX182a]